MNNDDLNNKIKKLLNEKYECELRIKLLDKEVIKTKYEISKKCLIINKKHKWITEIEEGPYGERFTYCEMCKINYYNDYFHY